MAAASAAARDAQAFKAGLFWWHLWEQGGMEWDQNDR